MTRKELEDFERDIIEFAEPELQAELHQDIAPTPEKSRETAIGMKLPELNH